MMAEIYKPPDRSIFNQHRPYKKYVFLAGSIEMGRAEDWQDRVGRLISNTGINVLNPRRDDWDSSWEQDINDDNFREQVQWELDGLELADAVLVYFSPETEAPISLLEFGLLSQMKPKDTFVCCPPGFWRRGNIQIVCLKFGMLSNLFDDLDEAVGALIGHVLQLEKPMPDPEYTSGGK